jgi:hypothetical protein
MEIIDVNLQSAHWRLIGNFEGYPALELEIDGKLAYVYDPNINTIENGFIQVTNLDGVTDWNAILPPISLDADVAARLGMPSKCPGAISDRRVVALADDFWHAINDAGGFKNGKQVF